MSGLDVERLVRAMHNTRESRSALLDWNDREDDGDENERRAAELIAAEYARLAESRPNDGLAAALRKIAILNRTYSGGKVTLDADAFDNLIESALTEADAAETAKDAE